jgi:hypothetical protein
MLMTEKEAAERLGIKRSLLRRQRICGEVSYIKIHHHFYYAPRQILEFLRECEHPAIAYLTASQIAEFYKTPDELPLPRLSSGEVALRDRNPKLAGQICRRWNRPSQERKQG